MADHETNDTTACPLAPQQQAEIALLLAEQQLRVDSTARELDNSRQALIQQSRRLHQLQTSLDNRQETLDRQWRDFKRQQTDWESQKQRTQQSLDQREQQISLKEQTLAERESACDQRDRELQSRQSAYDDLCRLFAQQLSDAQHWRERQVGSLESARKQLDAEAAALEEAKEKWRRQQANAQTAWEKHRRQCSDELDQKASWLADWQARLESEQKTVLLRQRRQKIASTIQRNKIAASRELLTTRYRQQRAKLIADITLQRRDAHRDIAKQRSSLKREIELMRLELEVLQHQKSNQRKESSSCNTQTVADESILPLLTGSGDWSAGEAKDRQLFEIIADLESKVKAIELAMDDLEAGTRRLEEERADLARQQIQLAQQPNERALRKLRNSLREEKQLLINERDQFNKTLRKLEGAQARLQLREQQFALEQNRSQNTLKLQIEVFQHERNIAQQVFQQQTNANARMARELALQRRTIDLKSIELTRLEVEIEQRRAKLASEHTLLLRQTHQLLALKMEIIASNSTTAPKRLDTVLREAKLACAEQERRSIELQESLYQRLQTVLEELEPQRLRLVETDHSISATQALAILRDELTNCQHSWESDRQQFRSHQEVWQRERTALVSQIESLRIQVEALVASFLADTTNLDISPQLLGEVA